MTTIIDRPRVANPSPVPLSITSVETSNRNIALELGACSDQQPHPVSATSAEDENSPELRRNLTASAMDGIGYSIMVGIAESYFGPFGLALGFDAAVAGLMVTVPVLLGATLQLSTPWAVKQWNGHKSWILAGVTLQILCLLFLPLAALFQGNVRLAFAYGVISLYWAASLSTGPSWNTWMEEIIPAPIRTHFFARRHRLSQYCLLASFVTGGLALEYGKQNANSLMVFTAIFLIAVVARIFSGWGLASQSPARRDHRQEEYIPLRNLFVSANGESRGGWLVLYLLAIQAAVQMAGPYFAPFMIKEEGMSYATYMLLISLCILGKALAMPFWGRIGQKYGPRQLLWIGGIAIIPLSSLWLLIDVFPGQAFVVSGSWLESLSGGWIASTSTGDIPVSWAVVCIACIQPLSGCAWSAYELGISLMLMHGIPHKQRTSMLTWYNFGNAFAMVGGSLLGAGLLRWQGETHGTYMMIFAASSFLRLLTVVLLMRVR